MEQYAKYLRKSRFDRDYAEMSVEETLKRHEAILDKMAKERGYHIAKTYYEVVSGESIEARPEIQKLLEEVNAGLYTGVLVVDVERLARGNGADQAQISQIFQFSGTKIITPMKTYDPSNEFDEEYFEFGLFMSRREYKTINRRLIRGRDSSAAEGKYISSIAPYGYKRVKLENEKGYTLAPEPTEAEEVKRIFDLFLMGQGTKMIANDLNDRSVPTRHGELWEYSTIAQILTNPIYMGKIRRGWSKQIKTVENGMVKKKIRRKRHLEEYQLYEGLHPALISEETFMKAQDLRMTRQPNAKVKEGQTLQNAFAGLIYCGCCGKRIGRTTMSNVQLAKSPGKSFIRLRCVNGRNCHNVSADYAVVEQEIINALRAWLEGYRVKVDVEGYADEITMCERELESARAESSRLQAQLENAYNLIEQGVYSLDFFKQRRHKLNAELGDVQQKINRLMSTIERLQNCTESSDWLIPTTETLLSSYDDMTVQERNLLLKNILQKITYRKTPDGKIEIDLYPILPQL